MTLDLKKLILNSIRKEQEIHHFEQANVELFKKEELPSKVVNRIRSMFGDTYLEDAQLILFFSGNSDVINKENLKKYVFKVTNAAAGSSANDLNDDSFKLFSYEGDGTVVDDPKPADDGKKDEMTDPFPNPGADEANGEALADALSESVQDPHEGERFAFVKITMK